VRRDRRQTGTPARPHRARRGFLAGVVLMAGSFLVYPAYPVLVFWPVSDRSRLEATLVVAGLSWVVFTLGLYLAGRRGWVWLRRRVKAGGARRGPPASPTPP
jgi:hypothetical protein